MKTELLEIINQLDDAETIERAIDLIFGVIENEAKHREKRLKNRVNELIQWEKASLVDAETMEYSVELNRCMINRMKNLIRALEMEVLPKFPVDKK